MDPWEVLKLQKGPLPPLRALNPRATALDEAIVHRALEADPERRFLDAEQLARALEGETVPTPPEIAILKSRSGFVMKLRALFRRPEPPPPDPVARIVDGIHRRVDLLRTRIAEAAPADRELLDGTIRAAEEAAEAAAKLADSAAFLEERDTPVPISPERARAREAAVARLLRIAATMDDALAAADPAPALEAVRDSR
jgi:hypothetical protein